MWSMSLRGESWRGAITETGLKESERRKEEGFKRPTWLDPKSDHLRNRDRENINDKTR